MTKPQRTECPDSRSEWERMIPDDAEKVWWAGDYVFGYETPEEIVYLDERILDEWLEDDYWYEDANRIAEGYWRE